MTQNSGCGKHFQPKWFGIDWAAVTAEVCVCANNKMFVSLNIFLELKKNDLGSLTSRTRKSSFLIYNCYRTGIKCPKQAGYHLDHQVETSPFHLRWLMLILFLLLSPQFRFPWSLSSSFKSYFSIIKGAPFWDVLVLWALPK